jgi:hypothetical protein
VEPVERKTPSRTGKHRLLVPILAVTGIVAVIGAVLLAVFLFRAADMKTSAPTSTSPGESVPGSQPYVDAAKTIVRDLTTISFQSVDADVQRVLDNATGQFYEEFSERADQFKQITRDNESISTGTVTSAILESIHAVRAQVLVTATVRSNVVGKPAQESRNWRLRVTVDKVGDAYKASKVEFMQQDST